jgi:2-dehydro-3-deoxyglucarate aldolase/4-hydroxy-2-oxoheptanedioate aldolase
MNTSNRFRDKIAQGQLVLGTCITFTDPTVTEALCGVLDFVWIDMEHNALSLEAVQGHIMATKGSETIPLVRVPWNDAVLIKPVLDIGAAGVIVPLIRTGEDARRAVTACLYPPAGIRGFGPRRPSNYGRLSGPEFCQAANDSMIVMVQIEHVEAVKNLDEILAVPGLTGIMIGPNDLAGSMGFIGQPNRPEVRQAMETVIAKARRKGIPVGYASGADPDDLLEWVKKGAQWLLMGGDFSLMVRAATEVVERVRGHVRG